MFVIYFFMIFWRLKDEKAKLSSGLSENLKVLKDRLIKL